MPALEHTGQSLLPYFPLARGLLTGKYRRGEAAPAGTRLAKQPEPLRSGRLRHHRGDPGVRRRTRADRAAGGDRRAGRHADGRIGDRRRHLGRTGRGRTSPPARGCRAARISRPCWRSPADAGSRTASNPHCAPHLPAARRMYPEHSAKNQRSVRFCRESRVVEARDQEGVEAEDAVASVRARRRCSRYSMTIGITETSTIKISTASMLFLMKLDIAEVVAERGHPAHPEDCRRSRCR